MESKTSFASKYKTQIDDARMFCDFYNPKEDTYCKRLQVLCPEHNPDPRFFDDEVSREWPLLHGLVRKAEYIKNRKPKKLTLRPNHNTENYHKVENYQ